MKTAHVKPAPGLKLRRPDRIEEILPPEGAVVALDAYWRSRIRDGDAEIVSTAAKPAHAPKAAAAKKEA